MTKIEAIRPCPGVERIGAARLVYMFQYIYSPEELGLTEWPSGTLRLEGIEVTDNPEAADVFVCPGSLALFRNASDMARFPYMAGRESRHVFFDVSDEVIDYNKPCIYIVCNLRPFMLASNPGAVNFAWPVENYSECVGVPESGFVYDISFRGWLSTDTRIESSNACKNNPALKSDVEQYSDFTGYLHDRSTGEWTAEGIRRRAEFRRSMRESRIALCPESIPGVFPYRFFEAMSAGRVPLLVSSDYVFPFSAEIPYSEFILTCSRENAANADKIALEFVRTHSDAQIVEMGLKARHYWELWLNRDDWPRTMGIAVKQKLAEMCA